MIGFIPNDDIIGEQYDETWRVGRPRPHQFDYRSAKKGRTALSISFGIVLLGAIVSFAICFPFLIKYSTRPDGSETLSLVVYSSSVRLLDRVYSSSLSDPQSAEFQALAEEFCSSLYEGGLGSSTGTTQVSDPCNVLEFLQGSILVRFEIKQTVSSKDVIDLDNPATQQALQEQVGQAVVNAIRTAQTGSNEDNIFKQGSAVLESNVFVRVGDFSVVNGKYGNWSEYSECTTKCNTGTRNRTRECNNPAPQNGGSPCVGPSVQYENCQIKDKCATVFAYKNGIEEGETIGLEYDTTVIDTTGHFDNVSFTVPETGIFFVAFTGGAQNPNSLTLTLATDATEIASIIVFPPLFSDYDTLHRSVLVSLAKDEQLRVNSENGTVSVGGIYTKLTSISIFSVTGLMGEDTIAFMVPMENKTDVPGGELLFLGSPPTVNLGSAFDSQTGTFVAPSSGYYYISMTLVLELEFGKKCIALMTCLTNCTGFEPLVHRVGWRGMDRITTASRSMVYSLQAGATLTVSQDTSLSTYTQQTSFHGFKYTPTAVEPVIFSAFNNYFNELIIPSINLINFNLVLTNEGNDFIGGLFLCRIPGLYYFEYSTGLSDYITAGIWLQKNGESQAVLVRQNNFLPQDIISRSIILDLAPLDRVHLAADIATGLITQRQFRLSFLGFIIQ